MGEIGSASNICYVICDERIPKSMLNQNKNMAILWHATNFCH